MVMHFVAVTCLKKMIHAYPALTKFLLMVYFPECCSYKICVHSEGKKKHLMELYTSILVKVCLPDLQGHMGIWGKEKKSTYMSQLSICSSFSSHADWAEYSCY